MLKSARDRIKKMGGNRRLLLLRISFLITFGLFFWGCYDSTDGVFGFLLDGIISVVLAAIFFQWVALGLLILSIPLMVLVEIFQGDRS